MGVNNIKYGVRFNCVFVIDLIVVPCFSLDVEFLDFIHVLALFFKILFTPMILYGTLTEQTQFKG
jgi:hypothetical protein